MVTTRHLQKVMYALQLASKLLTLSDLGCYNVLDLVYVVTAFFYICKVTIGQLFVAFYSKQHFFKCCTVFLRQLSF